MLIILLEENFKTNPDRKLFNADKHKFHMAKKVKKTVVRERPFVQKDVLAARALIKSSGLTLTQVKVKQRTLKTQNSKLPEQYKRLLKKHKGKIPLVVKEKFSEKAVKIQAKIQELWHLENAFTKVNRFKKK